MISLKTEAAVDYALHRLSCFDCGQHSMCGVAGRLYDQVISAQEDWAWFQDIAGAQEEWAWFEDIAAASEENPPTYTDQDQLLPGKPRHQGPGDVSGRIPD